MFKMDMLTVLFFIHCFMNVSNVPQVSRMSCSITELQTLLRHKDDSSRAYKERTDTQVSYHTADTAVTSSECKIKLGSLYSFIICKVIICLLFQIATLEQQILESSEKLRSAEQQITEKQQLMDKLVSNTCSQSTK